MTKLIQLDGFLVEVRETAEPQLIDASPDITDTAPLITRSGDSAEATAKRMEDLAGATKDTVASVCGYVLGAFEKANRPDELKVKFGLKLAGKAGIPFVTEGSGEAALEIEATWKRDSNRST